MTDFDKLYTRFNDDNPEALTERRVANFEDREIKESEEPEDTKVEDAEDKESEEPVVEEKTDDVDEGKVVTDKDNETTQKKKLMEQDDKQTLNEEAGYEGWKNYPTWAVNLWLDNDQELQKDMVAAAQRISDLHEFADYIKDDLEETVFNPILDDMGASLQNDLLSWSVENIDWREIAEHWMEKGKEFQPSEQEEE